MKSDLIISRSYSGPDHSCLAVIFRGSSPDLAGFLINRPSYPEPITPDRRLISVLGVISVSMFSLKSNDSGPGLQ